MCFDVDASVGTKKGDLLSRISIANKRPQGKSRDSGSRGDGFQFQCQRAKHADSPIGDEVRIALRAELVQNKTRRRRLKFKIAPAAEAVEGTFIYKQA